jgi:transposase-like protein
MKKTRAKQSAAFKAKVALEALQERDTVVEIGRRHKVHANVVYKWKRQLLENAGQAFAGEARDSDVRFPSKSRQEVYAA